ncbi:fusaric acid resistance protein, partial [Xanthomonas hyacinthi DSM 19077]
MSASDLAITPPATRQVVVETLREEASVWLFVVKTLIAFFLTGWLAMRFALPAPSTAMLTTVIVANRQSGMVLAKSFYRAIGTLAGATAAIAIVASFPQQRDLFLVALSLWIGLCAGGATLYRNFKSYAFVLGGYTAAIVAIPVIDNPPGVFDSSWARISEVLLGLAVSGVVNDVVFPSRMRD